MESVIVGTELQDLDDFRSDIRERPGDFAAFLVANGNDRQLRAGRRCGLRQSISRFDGIFGTLKWYSMHEKKSTSAAYTRYHVLLDIDR